MNNSEVSSYFLGHTLLFRKVTMSAIVYSFSSNPEGEWKNCQRVLKFLPLIFGSEASKQVKWVRNVRVDYSKMSKNSMSYTFVNKLVKSPAVKPVPCSPERNSVSIIRIRLREVVKCLELNDFSQTNSSNTHWVSFGGTR